jgi:phosphoenolpyruvate phosphomutase
MEAYNGLAAKIAAEAGFEALWLSSLCLTASMGMRDNCELSWTQICDFAHFVCESVDVPLLVDGDTGYGDYNNFKLFAKKLEKVGASGVCIEDKNFPKMNSFLNSESQDLINIEDFCAKIRAGKDVTSDKFSILARTEAFITGQGLEVALERAHRYVEAGADAIVVHSKIKDVSEVESFMKYWDDSAPIVVIPTKYGDTPTEVYEQLGISTVVWANHSLRASITGIQDICRTIMADRNLVNADKKIATVNEIFRLQDMDGYFAENKKYLIPAVPMNLVTKSFIVKEDLSAPKEAAV